jgi:hypothetical protein
MSSTAFTAKTFTFLHQVNHNPRLTKTDAAVCLELTVYFTESDQDGRAWPGCKTIADAIGVSEATVIRSVRRVAAEGHLRVVWGSQGRGHPNQYWMVLKPAPVKVSEAGKPASVTRLKPAPVSLKPAPVQENLLRNQEGVSTETPSLGERDALTRDLGEPGGERPEGAPPDSRKEESSFGSPVPETYSELRAIWAVRPWLDDPDADRRALEAAIRRGANPCEILDAARATVAAADHPRFLPALPKWLDREGYRKPPPAKRSRASGSKSSRPPWRKPDACKTVLGLVGYVEDGDGRMVLQ